MADNNVVDVTEVETKIERLKSDDPKVRLFRVTFDKFEDLPSEKGHMVDSSEFSCFGTKWRVSICPGGTEDSVDGMIGVFLGRCSESEGRDLEIKYSVAICSNEEYYGSGRVLSQLSRDIFAPYNDCWGWADVCSRKRIIGDNEFEGYLNKGALTVRVGLQLPDFIPKNPTSSIILKLFNDENSADIVFEIDEQQKQPKGRKGNGRKRAKTTTAKLYHAHRLILQHYSPELSALCATSDGSAPIIINDVKPEVFRHLLYYVYGGEISDEEFLDNERDLINAADKYGVTNLKLEAEVWCVKNTKITVDNMIDTLLYAHAMNCALLKESVMDFILENKKEVVQRVSFRDAPGEVCNDLLAAVLRHDEDKDSTDDDDDDDENEKDVEKMCSKMRIRDLRQMLDDKGLDIDGSREALIAKLKEHS